MNQVIFSDYRQDMVMPLIAARALRKSYDTFEAVRGLDFDVQPGEAFGLLGPNGAGKSSTMRMLAAVSPPTSGTLRILGMDPATDGSQIRARLGVVPQDDTLDAELTVRENLIVYGRYFGLSRTVLRERADELLEFAQLTDRRDERVERLSGGMRRRLTIARALVNKPDIVLLDEPTAALGVSQTKEVLQLIRTLRAQNLGVVVISHNLADVFAVSDRIIVLRLGRRVATFATAETNPDAVVAAITGASEQAEDAA
jgi:lipooligosaccharide transport system ATP-binding protein